MPVIIKSNLNLKKLLNQPKKQWKKNVSKEIKEDIIGQISKGFSPVKGGGLTPRNTGGGVRYTGYSDSYKKQMGKGELSTKKERPVNLKVTGGLHNSLRTRITKKGVFAWFTSELAKYHNSEGAGPSKIIRRLLPTGDKETFSDVIIQKIIKILDKVVKKEIKKQNR